MMIQIPDSLDWFKQLLKAAGDRRINVIALRPSGPSYEINWQRGARTGHVVFMRLDKSSGREIIDYICEQSGVIPFDAHSLKGDHEHAKPAFFEHSENEFSAWSLSSFESLGGRVLSLERIFPMAFESWSDLGCTANQIRVLKRNLGQASGVIAFNNIYLEQPAQAIACLVVEESKKLRLPADIVHVAESFYYENTDHQSRRIKPGQLEKILDQKNNPPPGANGEIMIIEPVMKNYISIEPMQFFSLVLDNRLVTLNCSYTKMDSFWNRMKSLSSFELDKLRLMVHVEQETDSCGLHDSMEIRHNFDFKRPVCSVCLDTGTVSVDHQVTMLEMSPVIARALEAARSGDDFIEEAESNGWFVQ